MKEIKYVQRGQSKVTLELHNETFSMCTKKHSICAPVQHSTNMFYARFLDEKDKINPKWPSFFALGILVACMFLNAQLEHSNSCPTSFSNRLHCLTILFFERSAHSGNDQVWSRS